MTTSICAVVRCEHRPASSETDKFSVKFIHSKYWQLIFKMSAEDWRVVYNVCKDLRKPLHLTYVSRTLVTDRQQQINVIYIKCLPHQQPSYSVQQPESSHQFETAPLNAKHRPQHNAHNSSINNNSVNRIWNNVALFVLIIYCLLLHCVIRYIASSDL